MFFKLIAVLRYTLPFLIFHPNLNWKLILGISTFTGVFLIRLRVDSGVVCFIFILLNDLGLLVIKRNAGEERKYEKNGVSKNLPRPTLSAIEL